MRTVCFDRFLERIAMKSVHDARFGARVRLIWRDLYTEKSLP